MDWPRLAESSRKHTQQWQLNAQTDFFFFFLKNPLYLYAPVSALKPDRCETKCSLSDFTSHTLYFWSVHLNTSSAAHVKHLILPSLSLCVVLEQSQHCSLCFVLSWNILEKFWMLKMSVIFTVYLRTFPWSSRHNQYGLKGVFMTHQNDPTVWILSVVVVKCFCLLCVSSERFLLELHHP